MITNDRSNILNMVRKLKLWWLPAMWSCVQTSTQTMRMVVSFLFKPPNDPNLCNITEKRQKHWLHTQSRCKRQNTRQEHLVHCAVVEVNPAISSIRWQRIYRLILLCCILLLNLLHSKRWYYFQNSSFIKLFIQQTFQPWAPSRNGPRTHCIWQRKS